MGARISPGFTIIETMLFLAVTGLLVMGVLIGTGSALNRQRYTDSVETFKNLVQAQYAELGSVKNSRSNTWSCDASALPATGGSEIRGQSGCLIVGKYMRIDKGDISIYTVLARKTGTTTGLTDIQTIDTNYTYNVSQDGVDNRKMEWGTQIAYASTGIDAKTPKAPRVLGLLFIRSPESGSIYTFSSSTVPAKTAINAATFKSIINESTNTFPGQGARTVCVQSSGLFPTSDMAVAINQSAANSSAVEIQSTDFMQTPEYVSSHGGIGTKC